MRVSEGFDNFAKSNYNVITLRLKLIQIGNSKGVRLPKAIIEQYNLQDELELELQESGLFLKPTGKPRSGWGASFRAMAEQGDDKLLDEGHSSKWDDSEWQW